MENNFINIRVFYNKMRRAKYISHLDITRCMQRALTRAKLPIWYTQGFNPHIYITFALPLSLGYESLSESMDLRLVEEVEFDEIKKRLNAVLPDDIRVRKVQLQINKPAVIKTAFYDITLKSDAHRAEVLMDCFQNMVSEDKIEVSKHTKKGNIIVDIKPDIQVISCDLLDDSVKIQLKTCAGIDKNINPTLLTDEFRGKYNLDDMQVNVLRKAILDQNGNDFE